jgi:hypothetical protein
MAFAWIDSRVAWPLLGPWLDVHARRPGRRLRAHRAPHDAERDGADGQRGSGGPGDQPRAPVVTSGSARLLECLRQVGHYLLGGGQFLSERFLCSSEFPGQPAFLITAAQRRRGCLRRMQPDSDNTSGDVHRAHRRVGQAAGQSLPRGQPGLRLRAHLPPFCVLTGFSRRSSDTSTDCHHRAARGHVAGTRVG